MKKIYHILILLILSLSGYSQVYQSMPQYGYGPVKRFWVDSTLSIPTVCGVPTLKANVTKQAAIAFDSCKNRFYFYNPKTLAWDTIKGGGAAFDSTSLSNRINGKVDSVKRSSDSIYYYKNGVKYLAFRDSTQNGRWGNDTATMILAKVHNDAGSQLTNGEVVYLAKSGSSSDVPSVKRAFNKADSVSANTFGFVTGTIANNDTGWVVLSGKIEKVNTSAFANGDILYLDSIAGKFTKTKPKAPYHLVYLGVVVKANPGNGAIFVKPQNGYELDEIHDVQINGVVNNQILVYSDTQKLWKNRSAYSVIDTTKLSARIDQRVKYSDTSLMLSNYATKGYFNLQNVTDNGNTTNNAIKAGSYIFNNNGGSIYGEENTIFLYDTSGKSIATFYPNNMQLTHDADNDQWAVIKFDNLTGSRNIYIPDNSGTFALRGDSSIFQTKYRTDSMRTNIYSALNGRVKYSDTASMLTNYALKTYVTLQNATANNSVTNQTIYIPELQLYDGTITEYGRFSLDNAQFTFTGGNDNFIASIGQHRFNLFGGGGTAQIDASNMNSERLMYLPDVDGTFAMRGDSSLFQTKYRTDSMRTNIYSTLNGRVKYTDTASMLTNYAKTNLVNTKVNISDTSNMLSNYAKTNLVNTKVNISDTATMLSNYFKTANFDNVYTKGMQVAGSTIKGTNLAVPSFNLISQTTAITNAQMRLSLIYLPNSATITGVKFYTSGGTNNAGTFSGVGLYKVRSGNDSADLVASSLNDTTLFDPNNSWVSKPFQNTYSASAGLYYAAIIGSYSSGTPSIGTTGSVANSAVSTIDISPNKIGAVVNSQTSFGSKFGLSQFISASSYTGIYIY